MERKKNKNCIIRLTEKEEDLLLSKSAITGKNKSEILRSGIVQFPNGDYDPVAIYNFYMNNPFTREKILDLLVSHFRYIGYPHRSVDDKELNIEMVKLSKTKSPLLPDNNLQTNTVGVSIANYFHHHMIKVRTGKNRAPYDQYIDDNLLRDAIKRSFELEDKPTLSNIRKILRTRDGVKAVVNFKPAVAKYFYDAYCPVNGRVLDPCAGYGGRLTGCIASNKGISYTGIEPCTDTCIGNMRLAAFYTNNWEFKYCSILGCAETEMKVFPEESFDFIFTSPPYFDKERYSDEKTQSYLKYPTYLLWLNSFLKTIIKLSYCALNAKGYFAINVKNYMKYTIADDTIIIAQECGFKLEKTYYMRLANLEYNLGKNTENKWHYEPIFLFTKQ